MKGIFYPFEIQASGGEIIKSNTAPNDTSKFWFNTNDYKIYYYNNIVNKWLISGMSPALPSKFDLFNDGSIIAFYKFDNNANDEGGVFNGTWSGNETYKTGKYGESAFFDGNSYITLNGLNSSVFNTSKPFSVSLILNFNDINDNWGRILCKGYYSNGYRGFLIVQNKNTQDIQFVYNSFSKLFSYDLNKDYHIVLLYDGQKFNVYINKELVISQSIAPDDYNIDLIVGHDPRTGEYAKNVKVDNLRFFSRALTKDEVMQIFNND